MNSDVCPTTGTVFQPGARSREKGQTLASHPLEKPCAPEVAQIKQGGEKSQAIALRSLGEIVSLLLFMAKLGGRREEKGRWKAGYGKAIDDFQPSFDE